MLTAIAFFDSPFNLLAIYGACVATISLGWNIYTWRQRERTRIEVSGSPSATDWSTFGGNPAFEFHCTNRSAHAVQIRRVWTAGQGSSNEVIELLPRVDQSTIDPHSSLDWFARYDELAQEGIDIAKGVRGHVLLVTGENEESPLLRALG